MGKIKEIKIDRFDGGIVNDPRNNRENVARVVTNFDILTDKKRMIPYRDSESGDSAPTTSQKQNFAIALRTGTTYSLYGLGVKSGATTAEVLYKDLTTGGTLDLGDAGWTASGNYQSASGATDFECFVYYKKQGLIYGVRAKQYIWSFSPGGGAWTDTDSSGDFGAAATHIAQGLVPSNDLLYIPHDNKIASKDAAGAFTVAALTLPTYLYITSICEYGNYLAIAAAPISGFGNSKVFLWDTNSTSWSEQYDWGEGDLRIIEEVNGALVGISATWGTTGGSTSRFLSRVTFRRLVGNQSEVIEELTGSMPTSFVGALPLYKQKKNNRLHFQMAITLNGTIREGVWSIGRNSQSEPFTIVHERTPNNDTALSSGILNGFYYAGDFLFQTYQSGAFATKKTNDTASYTAKSIYESLIFNDNEPRHKKKLLGVTVSTEFLPTAGQVVLQYQINENIGTTSWVTVFTNTTDDSIHHSAVNIESSGAALPEFKEIQFRIESTGGAVITGLNFRYDVTGKDFY